MNSAAAAEALMTAADLVVEASLAQGFVSAAAVAVSAAMSSLTADLAKPVSIRQQQQA